MCGCMCGGEADMLILVILQGACPMFAIKQLCVFFMCVVCVCRVYMCVCAW